MEPVYNFGIRTASVARFGQVCALKSASDSPDNGSVVQTTTTRRIIPVTSEKVRETPDFWEYLAEISPQEWSKHILYLYRTEPSGPAGQSVPMGKFVDPSIIPWNDREEAELAIQQKFGGRMFRVIVKRGPERVTEGKIYIDAPPRTVAPQPEAPAPMNPSGFPMTEAGSTAYVADRAINTIAGYERQGAQIGMEALTTAANVLARFSGPQNPPPEDELTRQMKAVMIQRMLQPPPDPIELLTKVLSLQSHLAGGPQINPLENFAKMVEMLKTFGVNIGGSSAPAVSAGAELMRQLPTVASYVTTAVTEWRHGMEAQRETVAMAQRNPPPPPSHNPTNLPPRILPAAPAPIPPVPANGVTVPNLEFVESKILELFMTALPADEAAERVLDFLEVMDGEHGHLVSQLKMAGETGLMTLFQTRPILKPATQNLPRLQEFIRAFLKYASDNTGEAQAAAQKPN